MAFKTVEEVILKTFIATVTLLHFNAGGKQGLKYNPQLHIQYYW